MAQWTNYYRIITPISRKATYHPLTVDDASNLAGANLNGLGSIAQFSNMTTTLTAGPMSRMTRYKQYDSMDSGDVSRALDIIGEEISHKDEKTNLQFEIMYNTEDSQDVSDNVVTTLRAALRTWCRLHSMHKRVFQTSRAVSKYGDCFFRKTSDTEKWQYVDHSRIVGIEIDPITLDKIAYHVIPPAISASSSSPIFGHQGQYSNQSVEIIPAEAMIHFTFSDDIGTSAPFGVSLLQPVFNDWQKLQMLESTAIIYRLVRAPERRVFYIDTGNMPPQRVKQYLEQIKTDIRQKRIPNANDGTQTDSSYNPESIQEDMFFPVNAAGRSSRVETLPGGSWEIPELAYFQNNVFRALRIPSSYIRTSSTPGDNAGAVYNDGKVGVAYIEELQFCHFIMRQQAALAETFDKQFKTYLAALGVNIDHDLFSLQLPEPQNFAMYRQAAIDTELINSFKAIEDTDYISKRMALKRYLGWTDDELQMNEVMRKQEKGIVENSKVSVIQQLYDAAVYDSRADIKLSPEDNTGDMGDMGSTEPAPAPAEAPPEENA